MPSGLRGVCRHARGGGVPCEGQQTSVLLSLHTLSDPRTIVPCIRVCPSAPGLSVDSFLFHPTRTIIGSSLRAEVGVGKNVGVGTGGVQVVSSGSRGWVGEKRRRGCGQGCPEEESLRGRLQLRHFRLCHSPASPDVTTVVSGVVVQGEGYVQSLSPTLLFGLRRGRPLFVSRPESDPY